MTKALLSKILDLTPTDRVRLAQDIWESVAELPDTGKLTDFQKEELDRRLASLEKRPDEGIQWQEVLADILRSR